MARIHTSGLDIDIAPQTTGSANHPDGSSDNAAGTNGATARETATVRSGSASLRLSSTDALGLIHRDWWMTGALGTTYYFRAWLNWPNVNPTNAHGVLLCNFGGTIPGQIQARLTPAGTLILYNNAGAVQVGAASDVISPNTWYCVELGVMTNTGATDYAELRLNGVSVAASSTLSYADTALSDLLVAVGETGQVAGVAFTMYADDVAVNDSTGTAQNSWPGASGKIVLLAPTADSAVTAATWQKPGGATTGLWSSVDNTPPVGVADSTNVAQAENQIRNAVSNATSDYDAALRTYAAAGIAAGDTVNVLHAFYSHGAASATSPPGRSGMIVSNPVGTLTALTTPAAAAAAYPTGWTWNKLAPIYAPAVTLGTAPVLRIRKTTASTNVVDVDFMGMYVEYTPAATAAVTPRRSKMGVGT